MATKSAGYILNTRAHTKEIILFLLKKLFAIRNPLVIKKTSTAISPADSPVYFLKGSPSTPARGKL